MCLPTPPSWFSKMELSFDPVIPLLGLYPKNPETPIQKNLCTPMFIAVVLIIAKGGNNPNGTENQDGGVGRHTAPPRTTRTDRESNSKGDQHQGNRK